MSATNVDARTRRSVTIILLVASFISLASQTMMVTALPVIKNNGDMPTEMFLHFFKSLSDAARMNLNIKAEGQNEHHKIEGIFKALARAIKMAVRRDIYHFEVPSSKGCI